MNTIGLVKETGRSMLEILCVLAIIGILFIAAVLGYNYMIDKDYANKIIYDGSVFYGSLMSEKYSAKNWTEVASFLPESKYHFTYLTDITNHIYIKVDEVDDGVCKKLIDFSGESVGFYTIENTEFVNCQKTNEIIMDFGGNGPMSQCLKTADCDVIAGGTFSGICDSKNQCRECDELSAPSGDRTICVCDSDVAVDCVDKENNRWCCPYDMLCSNVQGECIEDMICKATYSQETTDNTCHYTYTQEMTNNICHYTYIQEETDNSCHYIFTVNPDTNVVTLKKEKDCTGGKYCNLKYKNDTCSSGISNDTTDVWGACNDTATTIESCSYTEGTFEMDVGCPEQYYCNLIWRTQSCSGIQNETETAYGRCSFPSEVKKACPN